MSIQVNFSGASDDLIHVSGFNGKYDEVGSDSAPYCGAFQLASNSMEMTVHCIYDGTWAFAVTGDDGTGDAMPPWSISRSFGDVCPYSETLTIDVPDDTTIDRIR